MNGFEDRFMGIPNNKVTLARGHPFDRAIALNLQTVTSHEHGRESSRHWVGKTDPAYANFIGPFGGITAAQALNAVMQHPERLGDPIALTVNFAAALSEGEFRIEARPVRTNRSTQHWWVCMSQTDAKGVDTVVLTATGVTAVRRLTWSAVDAVMPTVPAPEQLPRSNAHSNLEWAKQYNLRACAGDLPSVMDGSEADSLTQLWIREEPARPLDFCSLLARADVFFPRVWRRRARMTAAGTVSMTVYFHAGTEELVATGNGYLLGQARAQSFFNGFFDQSAELWNEAGHLLATTHQIVYFKE